MLFSLSAFDDYTGFEVTSSIAEDARVTCYNGVMAQKIARNISKRGTFEGFVCDGREYNGDSDCQATACSESGTFHDYEFWSRDEGSNQHAACQCFTTTNNNFVLRPAIQNGNWGGFNGRTCNAAEQRIQVKFLRSTCPDGEVFDESRGGGACRDCSVCGLNEVEVSTCKSPGQDRVCRCRDGFFGEEGSCKQCTVCENGYKEDAPCQGEQDRTCIRDCADDEFLVDRDTCQKCTVCNTNIGDRLIRACTENQDAVCVKPNVPVVFDHEFVQGPSSEEACAKWGIFLDSLAASDDFDGFTVTSNITDDVVSCQNPVVATSIAALMGSRSSLKIDCDGHTFIGADDCQATECSSGGDSHDYEFLSFSTEGEDHSNCT